MSDKQLVQAEELKFEYVQALDAFQSICNQVELM